MMKRQNRRGSTLQHYSVTTILVVCFLAAVILLNVLFSQLANAFDWWIDMSGEQLFEVSDVSVSVLEEGVAAYKAQNEKDVSLRITFCIPEENVRKNELGYYILNCAENYKHALDFVELRFLDLTVEPQLADAYLSATITELTGSDMIVELCDAATGERIERDGLAGFRVESFDNLFTFSTDGEAIGFGGEYRLTSTMLSLLGGAPLAVFTTGNGESAGGNGLVNLIADSGFRVETLDLEDVEIPADAKLLVINAPTKDLNARELARISAFSNAGGHLIVFADPLWYALPNLTAMLAEQGVTFTDTPGYLIDNAKCLAASAGMKICGSFANEVVDGAPAKGTALTASLRSQSDTPAVFPNACAITKLETVAEDGRIGETDRYLSAVFTTTASATNPSAKDEAEIYGQKLIMTLTENKANGAKSLICGAPEFVSNNYLLNSSYTNRDLLTNVLSDMESSILGDARISVRLFDDQSLQISSTAADTWTWLLIAVLPGAFLVAGTIIYVRRKHL